MNNELKFSLHETHCDIKICRPLRHNAINLDVALKLQVALSELKKNYAQGWDGTLILKAEGDTAFCSGGDLKDIMSYSQTDATQFMKLMRENCIQISMLPFPTVCLLTGPAYGGGAELALATDFRIGMSPTLHLTLSQAKWGLPGGWNGMIRLKEFVPSLSHRKIAWLFCTQARLSKDILLRWNLLDWDFSDDHTLAATFLEKFINTYAEVPKNLRSDLLKRTEFGSSEELKVYDSQIFEKHWFAPFHLEQLKNFGEKSKS